MSTTQLPDVRTTRAEQMLYGPYAPLVRLMGKAAEGIADAGDYAAGMHSRSDEDDQVTERGQDGSVTPTSHTRWMQGVDLRVHELVQQAVNLHRELAAECADRFAESRLGDQCEPVAKPEPTG